MIIITFIILAVISAIVQFFVPVNYDMADYLPETAPSTEAMNVMEEEFDSPVANTRVMVRDVSVQEALAFKDELEAIDGVKEVSWLDDAMDIRTPLEVADAEMVETYYKEDNALFTLNIADGQEVSATEDIYNVIGEENALTGDALDTAISQETTGKETLNAALILVPMIILILVLSTSSWFEPVLFLIAIGISVVINLGTNIFL